MYGKLFEQMYQGTLAKKGPWEALVTFQQFIILADKNGTVDMTAESISARTTLPLSIIRKGILALQKPDKESRTPTERGRRIVLLSKKRPWGWRIVNYEMYRNIRSAEDRREYHRIYWHAKGRKKSTQHTQPKPTKAVAVAVGSNSKPLKKSDSKPPAKAPSHARLRIWTGMANTEGGREILRRTEDGRAFLKQLEKK